MLDSATQSDSFCDKQLNINSNLNEKKEATIYGLSSPRMPLLTAAFVGE